VALPESDTKITAVPMLLFHPLIYAKYYEVNIIAGGNY
jgi:hypothetical protein